ncbi:DISARM system helicase DrmA [Pseudonocardia alni subsp. carboxydivorans]|uniref:Helicase-related protein n=1 Tax=Pseudonocardia alni subsp. carboxydivorans TaxID=415010 RepID=A0ABU9AHD1_PSEA5
MTELSEQYLFREKVVEALERDVLGPSTTDEVLDEGPLDRYITGILYPSGVAQETTEEPDDPEAAESGGRPDGGYDPGVALARMKRPSSMGLSFAVDLAAAREITVTVTAGRYEPLPDADTASDETVRSRARRPRASHSWQRTSICPEPIPLALTSRNVDKIAVDDGLELYWVIRDDQDGIVPVTLVLRNTKTLERHEQSDAHSFFQPTITVEGPGGTFVDRRSVRAVTVDDDDLRSYDLLFRDVRNHAVGHGCAVEWDTTTATAVSRLCTTYLPSYELQLARPRTVKNLDLRMSTLATGTDDEILSGLRGLVAAYRSWIRDRRAEAGTAALGPDLASTANRHMDDAERAAARLESGIALLTEQPDAMRAFRLMNLAMQRQRDRQDWIRAGNTGGNPPEKAQTWYPFQIAFILLGLRGIAEPEHADRETADLLWFPTGGGKTEAYLGLIAFTVLLRRLRAPGAKGVAVLMRYTLRLLTIQQFERAASLICALEDLRRGQPDLRTTPGIDLGLWVGQGATPNTVDDARRALARIRRTGESGEDGNPVQLTRCPWCGTDLDQADYEVRRTAGIQELVLSCRDRTCAFADRLPIRLVDEDVYRARPSLLIGTVDKFAMLAWREKAGDIFSSDGDGLPPDLIVQDELHLISGPLGTLVGLYEAAVDAACTKPHRPKIVASTATIRRAEAQMRAVFDRNAAQFPPPGLVAGDTFFSEDAPPDQKGTRQYVGVMAPGTSQTTLMVRTYGALLQAARDIEGDDGARDPYWSLVGYFNSLRVLGGAYMQVTDDVPDRLKVIARRAAVEPRDIATPMELTSRTTSSDIPEHLARLGRSLPDADSPDVVLATNMISVGVDVDRLGLMAVMGQPQATAEYIQATSRVGRKFPGLVVTMYNSARSRDRSHYEDFLPYHQALYRQVEATSATPYAARARDRGLHGVLVAMARLLDRRAAPDSGAGRVLDFESALDSISTAIVDRAGRADPESADDTDTQLRRLIDTWIDEAAARRPLSYGLPLPPRAARGARNTQASLLVSAGQALTDPNVSAGTDESPWPTLTSLRDVDATSSLYLIPSAEKKRAR